MFSHIFFLMLTNCLICFNKENLINFHTFINLLLIMSRMPSNHYVKSKSGGSGNFDQALPPLRPFQSH